MASVCTAPPAILENVDHARVFQIVDIPAFLRIELSNMNLICYLQPTINQYDVYLAILPSHHLPPRLSNRQKLLDSFYKVGGLSRKPKNLFFVKKALVAFFHIPISAFFEIQDVHSFAPLKTQNSDKCRHSVDHLC